MESYSMFSKNSRRILLCSAVLLVMLLSTVEVGRCERIKDIVDIQGVRGNPLRGIGLVIGAGAYT